MDCYYIDRIKNTKNKYCGCGDDIKNKYTCKKCGAIICDYHLYYISYHDCKTKETYYK